MVIAFGENASALEDMSASFFSSMRGEPASGAVETPRELALDMVRCASQRFGKPLIDVSWLDPSAGTGAFPLAILEHVATVSNGLRLDNLPKITAIEDSSTAVTIMESRIDAFLANYGISIGQYLNSERLKLVCSDFFEFTAPTNQLLSKNLVFDIVIGNPPYVRSGKISEFTRNLLPSALGHRYTKSADLYLNFYLGSEQLIDEEGLICFVTPHNFLKNQSSLAFRRSFSQTMQLVRLIDLGERPVFDAVSVHAGVFLFEKSRSASGVLVNDLSHNPGPYKEGEFEHRGSFREVSVLQGLGTWIIRGEEPGGTVALNRFPTFSTLGLNIYSGVRTGLSKAYLLDAANPINSDLLLDEDVYPAVLARDIRESLVCSPKLALINLPAGSKRPSPLIIKHLERFKDELLKRSDVRALEQWYEQRQVTYVDKMLLTKIVFPDIASDPIFALAGEGELVLDGAYFIDSADLALLALLNSSFVTSYLRTVAPSIGPANNRGRLRMKKHIVETIPIPKNWTYKNPELSLIRDGMKKVLGPEDFRSSEVWIEIDGRIADMYLDGS